MEDYCNLENNRAEILIVEDSPTQAEELKYVLEQYNFAVSVARNGFEALSLIRLQKPSMVISDIIMPGMDGYQLCREIKQDGRLRDKAIFISGYTSDIIHKRGLLDQSLDFVSKPLNPKTLLIKIRDVLGGKA